MIPLLWKMVLFIFFLLGIQRFYRYISKSICWTTEKGNITHGKERFTVTSDDIGLPSVLVIFRDIPINIGIITAF